MAHFAELDSNNTVVRVIVISNDDITNSNNIEDEEIGKKLCSQLFGEGVWVQTSYNNHFRKRFGKVGYIYDSHNDVFISTKPFEWYILNDEFDWVCPESLDTMTGEPLTADQILLNRLNKLMLDIQMPEGLNDN